jgi:hypothetical protein
VSLKRICILLLLDEVVYIFPLQLIERAVELAFEGHRYNDLRRWLLLDKAPYNKKTAVYFDRAADQTDAERYENPKNNHVLNLREEVLFTRQLSDMHYWFPFPRKDVQMYEGFKQNPGWE